MWFFIYIRYHFRCRRERLKGDREREERKGKTLFCV